MKRAPSKLAALLAQVALVTVAGCGPGAGSGPSAALPTGPIATATAGPVASTGRVGSPPAPTQALDIPSDAVVIPLSGDAPDAIQIDGTTAWVLSGEGGTLMEVDLAKAREVRAIDVGFGPTHLGLPAAGLAAVARFDSGGGDFLELIDLAAGSVDPLPDVTTGELRAMTVGEVGIVWALEKADRLVKVNTSTRRVVDDVAVDVGENVHMEVQWGAGSAWVGSDATPVIRVAGTDLAFQDTIEVGGGVPFQFLDGFVWGAGPTELWSIDAATGEITRRIPLTEVIEILALDIEGEDAWIAVRRTGHVGRVLRLDLDTERVAAEYAVSLPAAVRIDGDRAWVASYLTNELIGFAR